MHMRPIRVGEFDCVAVEVKLPKTNLIAVQTDTGYVMCGALDVQLLRDRLQHRGIMAARAVGVKTIEELLAGSVESCTQEAERIGIVPGMAVQEALIRMKQAELAQPVSGT